MSVLNRPASAAHFRRPFFSSPSQRDVFFVAFPALKAQLLNLTRICLIVLPFVYRYRLHKKYPRTSLTLLQIPIFAICIVVALALDQSPHTQRWRLLLMTHREEIEWARHRFEEFLRADGPLLLGEDDPRVQQIKRITERIVTALEEPDPASRIVTAADRYTNESSIAYRVSPSAKAVCSASLPFLPESSNPAKVFDSSEWKIYVVDLPRINAFALPTRELVVYTGLIDLLEDDTLISAVLAHEVSHVVQRHAVENVRPLRSFINVATIVFDILRGISYVFTMSFPMINDAAASIFNIMNDYLAERAYSRKLEEEADSLGLEFMANAGYDPRGALDLWEVMAAVEEDAAAAGESISIQDRMTLLRTHPTSLQRQKVFLSVSQTMFGVLI
ncbi:uncharacterized protein EI90DRAFT_2940358 [Cantharellus anzutake]|uniref:uncharacterized protein n=1 Tax=Cantharellus anzutake TaxID=1750568 RepID=UPI0019071DC8|nr:uncharacterized protein EI90DRAFT_2940358 [Cantharellus anzutake]KAF8319585.1 hypothetical protein EI90DRAFT_2940358 [Cantharellus anzutake]